MKEPNAASFESATMKIMLHYGFCHMLIINKDSKFFSIFQDVVEPLNINLHHILGNKYDAMLDEHVNRFLNKCLSIFCNKQDSIHVAQEAPHINL